MQRRRRIHCSRDYFQLRLDDRRFLFRRAHDGQRPNSVPVQPHVLGETLRQRHGVPVSLKHSQRKGILIAIATGKPLVRAVQEWKQILILEQFRDFQPLFFARIDPGWVVRARVQQHDVPFLRVPQILLQPVKIQSPRVRFVISIRLRLHSRVAKNVQMIRPRRIWNVTHRPFLKPSDELREQATRSSPR